MKSSLAFGITEYLFIICFHCFQETVRGDAELAEFLLFLREELSKFERAYCRNLPSKDDYAMKVQELGVHDWEVHDDIHFRKWLWMLLKVRPSMCHCIAHLRHSLNYDISEYVHFAEQIEILYSVLCDDFRGKSPLEIRHMRKEKFEEYAQFFCVGLRDSIMLFLQSRDRRGVI